VAWASCFEVVSGGAGLVVAARSCGRLVESRRAVRVCVGFSFGKLVLVVWIVYDVCRRYNVNAALLVRCLGVCGGGWSFVRLVLCVVVWSEVVRCCLALLACGLRRLASALRVCILSCRAVSIRRRPAYSWFSLTDRVPCGGCGAFLLAGLVRLVLLYGAGDRLVALVHWSAV